MCHVEAHPHVWSSTRECSCTPAPILGGKIHHQPRLEAMQNFHQEILTALKTVNWHFLPTQRRQSCINLIIVKVQKTRLQKNVTCFEMYANCNFQFWMTYNQKTWLKLCGVKCSAFFNESVNMQLLTQNLVLAQHFASWCEKHVLEACLFLLNRHAPIFRPLWSSSNNSN